VLPGVAEGNDRHALLPERIERLRGHMGPRRAVEKIGGGPVLPPHLPRGLHLAQLHLLVLQRVGQGARGPGRRMVEQEAHGSVVTIESRESALTPVTSRCGRRVTASMKCSSLALTTNMLVMVRLRSGLRSLV